MACSSSKEFGKTTEDKKYFVTQIDSPITIDGLDNEDAWQNIPYSNSFVDIINGSEVDYSTKFKCTRDDKNIYFFVKLEEPHIRGLMTSHDTLLYNENCFEIFIDPDNDGKNYLELEINARETTLDLLMDKPYKKGGKSDIAYDIKGLEHMTNISGTINNPNDTDKFWTIEIAIPMSSVFELSNYGVEKSNFHWRVHLARMQFPHTINKGTYKQDPKVLPKVWVWNQQSAFDNHIPERWGYFVCK